MRIVLCLILTMLLAGCDDGSASTTPTPSPAPASQPSHTPTTRSDQTALKRAKWVRSPAGIIRFHGLEGPRPVTWVETRPLSAMRTANYVVPGKGDGDQAHIVIFRFTGTDGGTIEQNIRRWQGKFKPDDAGNPPDANREDIVVADLPVALIELNGEHMRQGNQWYTADQTLLGAVIEAPEGTIFVRLSGDHDTVNGHREAFLAFITGLQPVDAG